MKKAVARYDGLAPASADASKAARGSSRKRDTRCELALRAALRVRGLRNYRIDVQKLPGRPDLVFTRARVVVFCDGDFWHGRDLANRLRQLTSGHNAPYWVAKIQGNVERDRRRDVELKLLGYRVIRLWESEILRDPAAAAEVVRAAVTNPDSAAPPASVGASRHNPRQSPDDSRESRLACRMLPEASPPLLVAEPEGQPAAGEWTAAESVEDPAAES